MDFGPDEDIPTTHEEVFTTISRENLADFFMDKGVPVSCELCGTSTWTTHDANDNSVTAIMYFTEGPINHFPSISPIYMINCDNCGNMRIFSKAVIVNWLQRREKDRAKK